MRVRLRRSLALGCIGALAALAASVPSGVASPAPEDVPSRLLVTGREYSLTLSRQKLDSGDAIVQLYDFGEDPHDLVLQRVGSSRIFSLGQVQPGETGELRMKLRRASRYRLWCSIEGHAALGMFASLRTSKR